jgi:hypothetical protein
VAGHRVEGRDRLIRAFGADEHQVSDPLDLATELIQPLPAHGRGPQFRSQVHSSKYLVGTDTPTTALQALSGVRPEYGRNGPRLPLWFVVGVDLGVAVVSLGEVEPFLPFVGLGPIGMSLTKLSPGTWDRVCPGH